MGLFDTTKKSSVLSGNTPTGNTLKLFQGNKLAEFSDTQTELSYQSSFIFSPQTSSQSSFTDSRQFQQDYTYAPTIITNSAGATASPTFVTKKDAAVSTGQAAEQTSTPSVSQSAEQSQSLSKSNGLLLLLIGGAVGVGALLFVGKGKGVTRK